MELYKKSAAELSALLRSKEVTACEILDDTLARIDAVEPKVDAFLSVTADTARRQRKWMKKSPEGRRWACWPAFLWG